MKTTFISYGHLDAIRFAELLEGALIEKDYKVWRDKAEIQGGATWLLTIEKGIDESETFIAIITPHAYREEHTVSVKEVTYAIQQKKLIKPIWLKTCKLPLSVCDYHHLDLTNLTDESYPDYLPKIIEFIENKEVIKKDLLELSKCLNLFRDKEEDYFQKRITAFKNKIFKDQIDYTGRIWLSEKVDNWIMSKAETQPGVEHDSCGNILFINAGPGIGKSAFMARLIDLHERVIAGFICNHNERSENDPVLMIKLIAYQIASRYDWFKKKLDFNSVKNNAQNYHWEFWADLLLLQPLKNERSEKPWVLAIDGLDEGLDDKGDHSITEAILKLSKKLQSAGLSWIKFIVSSRPVNDVLKYFPKSAPIVFFDMDYEDKEIQSKLKDDIKSYLVNKLYPLHGKLSIKNPEAVIDSIVNKANGSFNYVKFIIEGILSDDEDRRIDPNKPASFPEGLNDFYKKEFNRIYTKPENFKDISSNILAIISIAEEPLSKASISEILDIDEDNFSDEMEKLNILFPYKNERYEPYRKDIVDWLRSEGCAYKINERGAHKKLAKYLIECYKSQWRKPLYSISFLPEHLIAANEAEWLSQVLRDLQYFKFLIPKGIFRVKRYWQLLNEMAPPEKKQDYSEIYMEELARQKGQLHVSEYLDCVFFIGNEFDESGKEAKSEKLYEEARSIIATTKGENSQEMSVVELKIGINKRLNKKYEKGISHFKRSIELRGNLFGKDSKEYAEALYRYATLLWEFAAKGELTLEKTIEVLRESNQNYNAALPIFINCNHTDLPEFYNDFSVLLNDLKSYPTSVDYCKKGIRLKEEKGIEDIFLGELYVTLASAYLGFCQLRFVQSLSYQNPFKQCISYCERAEKIFQNNYGHEMNERLRITGNNISAYRSHLTIIDQLAEVLNKIVSELDETRQLNIGQVEKLGTLLINEYLISATVYKRIAKYFNETHHQDALKTIFKIGLSILCYRKEEMNKSKKLMEDILAFWKDKSIDVYLELVTSYFRMLESQNDFNKTKDYFREYIELLPQIKGDEQQKEEIKSYLYYLLAHRFYTEVNDFCNSVLCGDNFRNCQKEDFILILNSKAYYSNSEFANAAKFQRKYVDKIMCATPESGESTLSIIQSINTLALYYKSSGAYNDAFNQYNQAINICIEELRSESYNKNIAKELLLLKSNKASLLREQGNYREAMNLFHEIIDDREELIGKDEEYAFSLVKRASVEIMHGEYRAARNDLYKAIQFFDEKYLSPNWNKAYALENLGLLESISGHYNEAIANYNEAEKQYQFIRDYEFKLNSYTGRPIERDLCELRIKIGKYYYYYDKDNGKSQEYFSKAYEYLNSHAGTGYYSTLVAKVFKDFSSFNAEASTSELLNDIDNLIKTLGEGAVERGKEHPIMAEIFLELGTLLNDQNYVNEANLIIENKLGENHILRAKIKMERAKINREKDLYEEAKMILKNINSRHPLLSDIRSNITIPQI